MATAKFGFKVGGQYTRKDVLKIIGIDAPDGGSWFTGHVGYFVCKTLQAIWVLFCLMCSTLLSGCGKADPEKTKQALTWLEQHYKIERFAARKGAEFAAFRVEADGNRLQVLVFMPSRGGANTLRGMETPQRHRYWERLACPSGEAPFWAIKDPKHSLVVELRGPTTFDRDYIIHVTCRQDSTAS